MPANTGSLSQFPASAGTQYHPGMPGVTYHPAHAGFNVYPAPAGYTMYPTSVGYHIGSAQTGPVPVPTGTSYNPTAVGHTTPLAPMSQHTPHAFGSQLYHPVSAGYNFVAMLSSAQATLSGGGGTHLGNSSNQENPKFTVHRYCELLMHKKNGQGHSCKECDAYIAHLLSEDSTPEFTDILKKRNKVITTSLEEKITALQMQVASLEEIQQLQTTAYQQQLDAALAWAVQAEYLLEEEKRISEHWKHQTLGKEEEEENNSDEESYDDEAYNVSEESEPEDKGNKLVGEAHCQQNAINRAVQKALRDKAVSRGIITKTEAKRKMKKEFNPIRGERVKTFMSMPSTMEEWTKVHDYLDNHKNLTGAKCPYYALTDVQKAMLAFDNFPSWFRDQKEIIESFNPTSSARKTKKARVSIDLLPGESSVIPTQEPTNVGKENDYISDNAQAQIDSLEPEFDVPYTT
ncbi:hypothetical protein GYMLUDRAFT_252721 [Collybiopsis luxurians FD-317 M1]|uniref:Uncharacterized protein n=1 Tax=Collybiopsis luxurians FD-317 M1 TaxID=944289 RepID=A0A0D0BMM5_9AGAR|nr:hypothetical protein GYMLUDRAFT_252721 [Collybiopsis luxurians FD-317 M1]